MSIVLKVILISFVLIISDTAIANDNIENCKKVISDKMGYTADNLEFHGKPVNQKGYISYLITGLNRDQFYCEVYDGNHYRIKAAINAKYPFRYIDGGAFGDK